MKFAINRNHWKEVTLGEVAVKIEENDRVNAQKRFDRFVKVEHMDAGSLHLKRWSSQSDGDEINPTFYKVFRAGQVLYPTRNPHLKRAVEAPFDGVCGEKTLTLEAKEELILPELFSFLFHSKNFYDHSTSSIIGSTNPHVRWRDIASFKFLLPPIAEQQALLELLKAADTDLQVKIGLRSQLNSLMETLIEDCFHGLSLKDKTITEVLDELADKIEVKTLSEIGVIFKGKGIPKSAVEESGIPCVRYGELYTCHHNTVREFHSFITRENADKSVRIKKGDVLFAGSGETISEIGKSASIHEEIEAYAGSDIVIFRPNDMNGFYSGYLMNSQIVRQQLNKLGTGATVMHIYGSDLEKIRVPVHSSDEQMFIAKRLERVYENLASLNEQIKIGQLLSSNIINRVF